MLLSFDYGLSRVRDLGRVWWPMLFLFVLHHLHAQDSDGQSNYVVVDVYIHEHDVTARINGLKEEGIEANWVRFGYPGKRVLYYVYVFDSKDFPSSLARSREYRQKPGYEDTWVFVLDPAETEVVALPAESENSLGRAEPANTPEVPELPTEPSDIEEADLGVESHLSGEGMEEEIHHEEELDHEEELEEQAEKNVDAGDQYYKLLYRSFYQRNGREVEAIVKVIDGQKSRLLSNRHSYEPVNFLKRKDPGYPVQIVCEAFGYKKETHDINLSMPLTVDTQHLVSLKGDTIIIDFPLFRHNMGDTLVMYNVFFYNDSNIMRPKSQYELHELLQMMRDNDDYHIAIHGHTNGNSRGRIIKLRDGDTDFFRVTDESVRTSGSARELSRLRAEIVKEYLVQNGIEENRMLVEGWGGKRMIYQAKSADAPKNARVEVVVLKD